MRHVSAIAVHRFARPFSLPHPPAHHAVQPLTAGGCSHANWLGGGLSAASSSRPAAGVWREGGWAGLGYRYRSAGARRAGDLAAVLGVGAAAPSGARCMGALSGGPRTPFSRGEETKGTLAEKSRGDGGVASGDEVHAHRKRGTDHRKEPHVGKATTEEGKSGTRGTPPADAVASEILRLESEESLQHFLAIHTRCQPGTLSPLDCASLDLGGERADPPAWLLRAERPSSWL